MRSTVKRWLLPIFVGVISLSLAGCGGFQLRSKPTAAPTPAGDPLATAVPSTATPEAAPTIEPTPEPTQAPTETPIPEPALTVGGTARVSATGGLNVRESASAQAALVSKLNPGDIVTLSDGPTDADGYTWWEIDNENGVIGWAATGTDDDPWLMPDSGDATEIGAGQLLDRAVQLGDRVQVTTEEGKYLNIRNEAGADGELLAKVPNGTLFTVRSGPVRQDELLWWELEGDNEIRGWAAEGEGTDRWLTPIQP